MKFQTAQEAFNHYRTATLPEIESRGYRNGCNNFYKLSDFLGYFNVRLNINRRGQYELYANVNYNAKGAHIKGLTNGKKYWIKIVYCNNGETLTSNPVTFKPTK